MLNLVSGNLMLLYANSYKQLTKKSARTVYFCNTAAFSHARVTAGKFREFYVGWRLVNYHTVTDCMANFDQEK